LDKIFNPKKKKSPKHFYNIGYLAMFILTIHVDSLTKHFLPKFKVWVFPKQEYPVAKKNFPKSHE